MDDWNLPKPRLALLLEHLAAIVDVRQPWRVAFGRFQSLGCRLLAGASGLGGD